MSVYVCDIKSKQQISFSHSFLTRSEHNEYDNITAFLKFLYLGMNCCISV